MPKALQSLLPPVAAALAALAGSASASATDAMEFPGYGTRALGRGGAWVASADDPSAIGVNPAGLVFQPSAALVGSHLVFTNICYERTGQFATYPTTGGDEQYRNVCNENTPTPLPNVAVNFRLGDRFALGVGVAPPMVYGSLEFARTVRARPDAPSSRTVQATPVRYQLLNQDGLLLNPAVSFAAKLSSTISVGASFIWGLGTINVSNAAMGLPTCTITGSPSNPVYGPDCRDDHAADLLAELQVRDYFIPGFIVGAKAAVLPSLDLGLAVRAQQAFDGRGDVTIRAGYWSDRGTVGSAPVTRSADIGEDLASFRLERPLEVNVGTRFHWLRGAGPVGPEPDTLNDDVFDVELGVSYSRNSAHRAIEVRFDNQRRIPIQGAAGEVPPIADVPLELSDSVGVRLGGHYVILPGQILVRAGGWFEPEVQAPEYLNVALFGTQRLGLSAGVQGRFGDFNVDLGFMHVFVAEADNGGKGKARTITGKVPDFNNPDPYTPPYRSPYPINGGKLTGGADIVSLSVGYEF